eukprot:9711021-Lingulodinium_polyedra.AAC.1
MGRDIFTGSGLVVVRTPRGYQSFRILYRSFLNRESIGQQPARPPGRPRSTCLRMSRTWANKA